MTQDDDKCGASGGKRRAKRVTASDVAKAAGVSRPAVSRAFTPGAYLDKEKRSIILSTAMRLGYRPNALAASLHGNSTNLVGVVAGDLDNHYDAEFVALLISRLNAANKWPLILGGVDMVTEQSLASVLNYPLDALIIRGGSIPSSLIDDCAKLSIPLIFSGHVVQAAFTDCVCCRNGSGAAMAVDLLVKKGRKAFGFISGPDTRSSANERLAGVKSRLRQSGLELIALSHSDYTYGGGRQAGLSMLSRYDLDAILCANDAMALGALSAARATPDRTVPETLSIVGFDDIAMASWPDFNLTTVRNPLDQTVSEILRLLEARLEAPEKPGTVSMIGPVLVERGSH